MRKGIAISILSLFISSISYSQSVLIDTTLTHSNQSDIYKPIVVSSFNISEAGMIKKRSINGKSFLLPGGLILTGALLFDSQFNKDFQKKVTPNDLSRKIHIDNYLQYTPAGFTIFLETAGLKGTHTPLQTTMIYAMSNVILNAVVIPTKHFSHELRPDSSDYYSFPSGHTTEAFASAELMRLEYRETQPWLGVAGYLMAATTGYLRMYNNKHWLSDVITGAGIGIASTRLSYLIFDKLYQKKTLSKANKSNTFIFPAYQNRQWGSNLAKRI